MPTPEAPFWLQELHWIFSTKIPPSAQVIVMLLGLYTAVSQSHVSICLGVGAEDFWAENKLAASAADKNTAPAVMATLDLLTFNGFFQGLNSATDLVGFCNSTFGGQDVCNLFLKLNCQFPVCIN